MDLESGIEMGKVPLTKSEADLPITKGVADFPELSTVHSGSPEDDDVYLEELPEWTAKEVVIVVMATGSGELLCFQFLKLLYSQVLI